MDSLLISSDMQRTIFAVLSSVLHLGNVDFLGKDEAKVDEKSMDSLQTVARYCFRLSPSFLLLTTCRLLGFDLQGLIKALTTRSITVRGQTTVLNLKNTEAVDGRDALAKALYLLFLFQCFGFFLFFIF